MAALIQSTSNVEATYEDMFKEITRKLYGEETGNGLHTLGTPVAQVATTGPTAPEGERSFTNLQMNQSTAPTIEYEHNAGAAAQEGVGVGIGNMQGGTGNVATVTAAAVVAAAAAAAHVQLQPHIPEGSDNVTVIGNETAPVGGSGNFKSEDHLNTAFGLAALMQNGFAQNPAVLGGQLQQNVKTVNQQPHTQHDLQPQQQWGHSGNEGTNDEGTTEPVQILHWTSAGKLQNFNNAQQQQEQHQQSQPQQHEQTVHSKPKAKSRHDLLPSAESAPNELIFTTPPTALGVNVHLGGTQASSSAGMANSQPTNKSTGSNRKKSQNTNNHQLQQQQSQNNTPKRYACTHCPYSTDRRDLYTRHENIHKDEKPFQCYACLKQFNRADHVKKHFLRMHRELQYDINKTRRNVSATNTGTGHQQRNSMTSCSSSSCSPEQKHNIFHAANVQLENAFIQNQPRQTTASTISITETIEAVARATDSPLTQMKQEKCDDLADSMLGGMNVVNDNSSNQQDQVGQVSNKPKREKRFTCMYCSWSGADKWGLKRHLNTHTKPFVCLLCDYKAARSERLATHILKVHNKRACNKCAFLADTQEEYQIHINEVHPHDNRPSRHNNNSNSSSSTNASQNNFNNVLCSIGSSLIPSNSQLNLFPNSDAFGVGNNNVSTSDMGNSGNTGVSAGGAITIYTTTTTTTSNDNGILGSGNNISTGGPLQEIIVNPTSMVGWRLSANGSLIPPHDILSSSMPTAAAQKRGSERLFQYLEADGSDPEDYARLLKMDAISRNTASVAQDFHKAGGVQELKLPANQQLLFDNKLLNQWTTKEAAALLQSLSNNHIIHQQQQSTQQHKYRMQQLLLQQTQQLQRQRHHSTGEDDENTPSSSSSSSTTSNEGDTSSILSPPKKLNHRKPHSVVAQTVNNLLPIEQKKVISTLLGKNFDSKETHVSSSTSAQLFSNVNNNTDISTTTVSNTISYIKRKTYNQQLQLHNNKLNDDNIENDEDQENQEQLIQSPPAYKFKYNNNNNIKVNKIQKKINNNHNNNHHQQQQQQAITQKHRLDLYKDNKENKIISTTIETNAISASDVASNFLTTLEYQNMNSSKFSTHIENYVKDIISKYYSVDMPQNLTLTSTVSTPPTQHQQQQSQSQNNSSLKRKRILSETEEYIEYLKNKSDITLTITPKTSPNNQRKLLPTSFKRHSVDILPSNNYNNKIILEEHKKSLSKQQKEPQLLLPPSQTADAAHDHNKTSRKSLSQIATLLPLLADAASKLQYLATPLDFSKKSSMKSPAKVNEPHEISNTNKTTVISSCNKRKQAQPKKKIRPPPEVIVVLLRDKYLNRMVNHKLSCRICVAKRQSSMLVFNYHTKGSLALHRLWKHSKAAIANEKNKTLRFKTK